MRSIAISILAFVSACSTGGGGGPTCREAGGACAATGDCCNGLVCTANKCTAPASCGMQGDACSKNADCCGGFSCGGNGKCTGGSSCGALGDACSNSSPCCPGETCTNGKCVTPPMCGQPGASCDANTPCCQGETCTGGTCMGMDTRKPFGSPCTQDTDCLTNQCVGYQGYNGHYCSAACNNSALCAQMSANPTYWCIAAAMGVNYCLRSCSTSQDCVGIGPDWSCRQVANIENQVENICGIYKNQAAGFPCRDNSQCAAGQCNTLWCADPCVNDAACGQYAKCLLNNNQAYTCFPSCTTNNDCLIFGQVNGQNLSCKSATSRDNAMVMTCQL